jgi:hypothetical protein
MLSSKPRMHSERVDCKSALFPSFRPFDGAQDRLQPESRRLLNVYPKRTWMPACAGMTNVTLADGEKISLYLRKTLNRYSDFRRS